MRENVRGQGGNQMKKMPFISFGMLIMVACGGGSTLDFSNYTVDTILDHDKVQAGGQTQVTCVIKDPKGREVVDIPTDVMFQTPDGVDAPTLDKGTFVLTKTGTYKIACQIQGGPADDSPAELTVTPGPPVKTVTLIDPDHVGAGEPATATCTALDKYGNPIPDAPTVLDPVKD